MVAEPIMLANVDALLEEAELAGELLHRDFFEVLKNYRRDEYVPRRVAERLISNHSIQTIAEYSMDGFEHVYVAAIRRGIPEMIGAATEIAFFKLGPSWITSILGRRKDYASTPGLHIFAEALQRMFREATPSPLSLHDLENLASLSAETAIPMFDLDRFRGWLQQAKLQGRDYFDYRGSQLASLFPSKDAARVASALLLGSDAWMRVIGGAILNPQSEVEAYPIADALATECDLGVALTFVGRLVRWPALLHDASLRSPIAGAIARAREFDPDLLTSRIVEQNTDTWLVWARFSHVREHGGSFSAHTDDYGSIALSQHAALSANVLADVLGLRAPAPLIIEDYLGLRLGYFDAVLSSAERERVQSAAEIGERWDLLLRNEEEGDRLRDELAAHRVRVADDARALKRELHKDDARFEEFKESARESFSRRVTDGLDRLDRLFPELDFVELELARRHERSKSLEDIARRYDELVESRDSLIALNEEKRLAIAAALPPDLPIHPEGLLGTYQPVDRRIILYPTMHEIVARVLGCDQNDVRAIASLHESAHAVLVSGTDASGQSWPGYENEAVVLHELLAEEATARAMAGAAYEELRRVHGLIERSLHAREPVFRSLALHELKTITYQARAGELQRESSGAVFTHGAPTEGPLKTVWLLEWLRAQCKGREVVGRGRALRLELATIRRHLAMSGRSGPNGIGVGLGPVWTTPQDFLQTARTSPVPAGKHKKSTRARKRRK